MAVYIALLRGINVGGKNIIKMADLKKLFESLGLLNAKTYIQSGNIVFQSNADEHTLRQRIEAGITATFGFNVPVVLRTAKEIDNVIKRIPYSVEDRCKVYSPEFDTFYFAFFISSPSQDKIEQLNLIKNEDDFVLFGRDAYLLLKNGIRSSKLAVKMQKLDEPSTIRNFKTISTLLDLAKEIR